MNLVRSKLVGKEKSLEIQIEVLKAILCQSNKIKEALYLLEKLNLKDYYLAAGSINQTVFNYYHDYELDYGIEDLDIVYYDEDTSYEKEDQVIKKITKQLQSIPISLDIKNEARVHLWYGKKYKKEIKPYTSVEDAISSWGTTVTCIGVRLEKEKLIVYAPYGLNDLFSMTIRPIKKQFTKERYQSKVQKWQAKWPLLEITSWNEK